MMSENPNASSARIRLHSLQPPDRFGGETKPYEYPHLYQIQAGDWRISYAVERNRLAILVLEVLGADGAVVKDPIRETLARKMKVKLLDWPEGSPSRDLPAEELGKRVKIRLLDLEDDLLRESSRSGAGSGRVRLGATTTQGPSARPRIILDSVQDGGGSDPGVAPEGQGTDPEERKVTPLDSPSVA